MCITSWNARHCPWKFFSFKKIWFKKKFLNKNVEFFLVYVTPRASMGYLKNVGTFSWIRKIWLSGSGSGSAKICGSTDPDPRTKYQPKTTKKNFFTLKTLIWTIEKREIKKIWWIKFQHNNKRKFFCVKKISKS